MNFEYSDKTQKLMAQLEAFMAAHILPRLSEWRDYSEREDKAPPFLEELKQLAREEGLWNLFLPGLRDDEPGQRLSNLEYAPLAEIMGRVVWSSEVFNCSAPDSGNMEILHMFGTDEQKAQWLAPSLNGEIRSCFAMTEPDVASSDATNIQTLIHRDGDDYVINGRKWFISGASNPNCKFAILMGITNPEAEIHRRQSMIIVPMDAPGVEVIRNIPVMHHHSIEGHCEMVFREVRVPAANILKGEGDGFAIAQARLGPGRIHHCMRSIGQAELALQLMTARASERQTFGKPLYKHGVVEDWIAQSRMAIDQARLLVLKAAWLIDNKGIKAARKEVAMIKAVVPKMQVAVCDRAMQVFGAMGLSPDVPLAELWTWGRILRIADGPDEVHGRTVAKLEMQESQARPAADLAPFFYPS